MDLEEWRKAFAEGLEKLKERDERFHEKFNKDMDRLKERHEALTETVEFNQHQFARHEEFFAKHQESLAAHEQLFGEIALRFKDTRETIDRLARIAGVHQDRLDEHEKRLDDLESH